MKPLKQENRYKDIWNYLSNLLTEKEEVKLLDWVENSERNRVFFNSVVADFNRIHTAETSYLVEGDPIVHSSTKMWKYGIAATILLLLAATFFLTQSYYQNTEVSSIYLSDNTKISLTAHSTLNYDVNEYEARGIIQIEGKAWISCPSEKSTLITIKTSAGYYLLEDAVAYIENDPSGNSTIQLIKGKARLITLNKGTHEMSVSVGQKLSFDKEYNAFIYSQDTNNPI